MTKPTRSALSGLAAMAFFLGSVLGCADGESSVEIYEIRTSNHQGLMACADDPASMTYYVAGERTWLDIDSDGSVDVQRHGDDIYFRTNRLFDHAPSEDWIHLSSTASDEMATFARMTLPARGLPIVFDGTSPLISEVERFIDSGSTSPAFLEGPDSPRISWHLEDDALVQVEMEQSIDGEMVHLLTVDLSTRSADGAPTRPEVVDAIDLGEVRVADVLTTSILLDPACHDVTAIRGSFEVIDCLRTPASTEVLGGTPFDEVTVSEWLDAADDGTAAAGGWCA